MSITTLDITMMAISISCDYYYYYNYSTIITVITSITSITIITAIAVTTITTIIARIVWTRGESRQPCCMACH